MWWNTAFKQDRSKVKRFDPHLFPTLAAQAASYDNSPLRQNPKIAAALARQPPGVSLVLQNVSFPTKSGWTASATSLASKAVSPSPCTTRSA